MNPRMIIFAGQELRKVLRNDRRRLVKMRVSIGVPNARPSFYALN
jgi:hypothetical protein